MQSNLPSCSFFSERNVIIIRLLSIQQNQVNLTDIYIYIFFPSFYFGVYRTLKFGSSMYREWHSSSSPRSFVMQNLCSTTAFGSSILLEMTAFLISTFPHFHTHARSPSLRRAILHHATEEVAGSRLFFPPPRENHHARISTRSQFPSLDCHWVHIAQPQLPLADTTPPYCRHERRRQRPISPLPQHPQ